MALEDDDLPLDDLQPDDLDHDDLPPEDDAGDEGGAALDEEDPPIQPRRQPGRAERAVTEAKREARETRERADRIERELAELRAERNRPDPYAAQRAAEAERERIAYMSPEERIEFEVSRARQQFGGELQAVRRELAQAQDERKYEATLAGNPSLGKYTREVDRMHADSVRAGSPVAKSILLKLAIGEAMVSKAPAARQRQGREGRESIARESVRAPGGQSVVRGGGRADSTSMEALENRLRGVDLSKI